MGLFLVFLSIIYLPLYILKRNMFIKKSSQENTNVKYCLINDSSISNIRESQLCLDLDSITRSDNCTTTMESLAHAVDNTYKLCCPIKSKTLSNKDLKKPWITREIIKYLKKTTILHSAVNKLPK